MVTVIDVEVAPVLHSNEPVNELAVRVELPQLLSTETAGAAGMAFTVSVAELEFTEPTLLVHTARYCLLFNAVVALILKVPLVAPLIFVQLVPLVLSCHCAVGVGLPEAAEVKVTLLPAQTVFEEGWSVIAGNVPSPLVVNTTSTQ